MAKKCTDIEILLFGDEKNKKIMYEFYLKRLKNIDKVIKNNYY